MHRKLIAIYENPKDFPGQCVGRLWELIPQDNEDMERLVFGRIKYRPVPTAVIWIDQTVEGVRKQIYFQYPDMVKVLMKKFDPVVVETWIDPV